MKIVFRKDLIQTAQIDELNKNKVELSVFNTSVNDIISKLNTVKEDLTAADEAVKKYAADLTKGLEDGKVKEALDAIAKLNAGKDVDGSIDNKIKNALETVVNGAPEAYDTLKELLELINKEGADFNDLIKQLNAKVDGIVGNASEDFATLEKAEATIKAKFNEVNDAIAGTNVKVTDVAESIPTYAVEMDVAIGDGNKITLAKKPKGDIVGKQVTVYVVADGMMEVEGFFTVSHDKDDTTGKVFVVECEAPLTAFKAKVEYFWTVADNK